MPPLDGKKSHPAFLSVNLPNEAEGGVIQLVLQDEDGAHGMGTLDLGALDGEQFPGQGLTWKDFLQDYRSCRTGLIDQQTFGQALIAAIRNADARLSRAWSIVRRNAGGRPLNLTVSFGPGTERFAALPLELLHDEGQFLFALPDSALTRCFATFKAAELALDAGARVLFAWAKPEGSGSDFDPTPHEAALRVRFDTRLEVLADARRETLVNTLEDANAAGRPFRILHFLGHGGHDGSSGFVVLTTADGGLHEVRADSLASVLKSSGVRLAFLCSCQTAIDSHYSGVAQQLLLPDGGDLSVVIATQAKLPVARSAELASAFYAALFDGRGMQPSQALAHARINAYHETSLAAAWSIPICIARPPQVPAEPARKRHDPFKLPRRRDSYQDRPEILEKIVARLTRHRLVSLVGLPGIGKTELGKESARAYLNSHHGVRGIYQPISHGLAPDSLRGLIAAALGQVATPENDAQLAALLTANPTLLILDNAEEMMLNAKAQSAFARQLDQWLEFDTAGHLKVLLTTRWCVKTQETEIEVRVPPMTRAQTEALLLAELTPRDALPAKGIEAWIDTPEWSRLLAFLDGHPRSTWLVSRLFEGPNPSLKHIVDRLDKERASVIVDPHLYGRADNDPMWLDDKDKGRMRNLVASIKISFDVVKERHPRAAAAFLALSAFSSGVPETVAQACIAATLEGTERDPEEYAIDILKVLQRYYLIERDTSSADRCRVFYPTPLQWYAEHAIKLRAEMPAVERERELVDHPQFVHTLNASLVDIESGRPIQLSPASRQAALVAYADYVDTLNAGWIRDTSPTWVADWLKEERTLLSLARPPAPVETPATGPSALARIAGTARNLMMMSQRLGVWQQLTEAGLDDARAHHDAHGEANTLQALGDLHLRNARLDDARQAYEKALELFRAVDARLGEANTLQGLGLLALGGQDAPGAFRQFVATLALHGQIDSKLGQQAALGYAVRAAMALGETDRALLLAGDSLALGREIGDHFGQSITLQALLGLFQQAQDIVGLVACVALYRAVLGQLGDAEQQAAMAELWQQLEADLPAELMTAVAADPWGALQQALAQARQRFGGGDPLVLGN